MRTLAVALLACFFAAGAAFPDADPGDFILAMTEDTVMLDSGRPGPILFAVAGVHGDEPSGPAALALAFLAGGRTGSGRGFGLSPERGVLAGISAASREAVRKASRTSGTGLDMNRLFPGPGPGIPGSVEARRAASIFATALYADLVLDLHEEAGAQSGAGVPTLVINSESAATAMAMIGILAREGLEFSFAGGASTGSLVEALERSGRAAIAVEVPQRLSLAEKTALQTAAVRAAMRALGMLTSPAP